ncbi:MAG: hypothetical protein KF857_12400 [Fimbriimonadaceae bacterium]|nr:hypothetical protein [Fimbriimonadaceae bacterium]
MGVRTCLGAVALAVAGCVAPSPSGEVVDVKKLEDKSSVQFLPGDTAKQEKGVGGMKGFYRPDQRPPAPKARQQTGPTKS